MPLSSLSVRWHGKSEMNIINITIVKDQGSDDVFLETDLPSATWPYTGTLSLKASAARGSSETYIKEHFPDVPVKIVEVPGWQGLH